MNLLIFFFYFICFNIVYFRNIEYYDFHSTAWYVRVCPPLCNVIHAFLDPTIMCTYIILLFNRLMPLLL